MLGGSRLRQARERLGLTFRDVERASYLLAGQRGLPDFIVHISRLADIENRGVVPSLHKLYSLAVIYHLNPVKVCQWYDVPLDEHFADSGKLTAPNTHLAAPPSSLSLPLRFDPGFNPSRTEYLTRMVERWGHLEGTMLGEQPRYHYGYIGLEDHRMDPLLRPGSLVLVDPARQQVRNSGWNNEYERPIYFVEVHSGFRCAWCMQMDHELILQPHPLSSCAPEVLKWPGEAEVVGQVVGVVMRLIEF